MTNSVQMLGPYRLLEPLGQGGMASVYKAYHPKLDRVVAIKMIHQNFLDDASFVARFEREAQIVARLEHPNIVPIYDYSEYQGVPYLVMKYIEGSTLKNVLSAGPLYFDDTLRVMQAISSALDYAHSQNILHRDIKPSNVMLDMKAMPYLADFGLARIASRGGSTLSMDMLIGTPYYMSPEQARGDKELDGRTDIYSLGVMLYELVTGTVPYNGTTPYSIIHQHITAQLPPPSHFNSNIPPSLSAVIERALAKDPAKRYASAGDMMTAVRAALPPDVLQPVGDASSLLSPPDAKALSESIVLASHQPKRTIAMPNLATPVESPFPPDSELLPATSTPKPSAPELTQPTPRQARRRWGYLGVVAGAALALAAVIVLFAMARQRAAGTTLPTQASLPTIAPTAAVVQATSSGPTLTATVTVMQTPSLGGAAQSGAVPPGPGPRLIEVPVVTLDQAQAGVEQQPDSATAYLALFRAQMLDGQLDALVDTLEAGAAVAQDKAIFVLTAATVAFDDGHPAVGVAILRDGLTRLQADPNYPVLRGEGGALLYSAAQHADSLAIFDLAQFSDITTINRSEVSSLYIAMVARAFLTAGSTRLAGLASELALRRDSNSPEALLVSGEVKAALGDTTQALALWERVSRQTRAPEWVRARVAELLNP